MLPCKEGRSKNYYPLSFLIEFVSKFFLNLRYSYLRAAKVRAEPDFHQPHVAAKHVDIPAHGDGHVAVVPLLEIESGDL